jgi:hypothetical protein
LRAKKFKELVDGGKSMQAAADEIKVNIQMIEKAPEKFGRQVKETIETYGFLTSDIKREFVRARQLELLMRVRQEIDTVEDKRTLPGLLKIEADLLRVIGLDKDVNLFSEPKPAAILPVVVTDRPQLPPALQQILDKEGIKE